MSYAVIMAGGAGTRLWPLSRRMRPKQLLRLFDGASLLQIARRRLSGLFPPENILVITSAAYVDLVAHELPDLPRANLIGEPLGRDTANAIGLTAELLARRDPETTMAVFTADHLIEPQDRFETAIRAGISAAEQFPDALVTFGIVPDTPHTGYGYIRRGAPIAPRTFHVQAFKEKPPRDVAEEYVASAEYYWNSGMFVWKLAAIRAELRRLLPENARQLAELAAQWDEPGVADERAAQFARLSAISIDFGVMEKAARVLVVEMGCRWLDLGSFLAIAATRPADQAGNVRVAPRALAVDSRNNVLVSEDEHLLVTLGLADLVVVHAPDATLVCRRDMVQKIRDLAALRKAAYGEQYE